MEGDRVADELLDPIAMLRGKRVVVFNVETNDAIEGWQGRFHWRRQRGGLDTGMPCRASPASDTRHTNIHSNAVRIVEPFR